MGSLYIFSQVQDVKGAADAWLICTHQLNSLKCLSSMDEKAINSQLEKKKIYIEKV